MVEKVLSFYTGNDKIVEKVIMDENLHYMIDTWAEAFGVE